MDAGLPWVMGDADAGRGCVVFGKTVIAGEGSARGWLQVMGNGFWRRGTAMFGEAS